MTTVTETLRQAMQDSGCSAHAIHRQTGVPYASVWRFLDGERIRSDHLDTLAIWANVHPVARKFKAHPPTPKPSLRKS